MLRLSPRMHGSLNLGCGVGSESWEVLDWVADFLSGVAEFWVAEFWVAEIWVAGIFSKRE